MQLKHSNHIGVSVYSKNDPPNIFLELKSKRIKDETILTRLTLKQDETKLTLGHDQGVSFSQKISIIHANQIVSRVNGSLK